MKLNMIVSDRELDDTTYLISRLNVTIMLSLLDENKSFSDFILPDIVFYR